MLEVDWLTRECTNTPREPTFVAPALEWEKCNWIKIERFSDGRYLEASLKPLHQNTPLHEGSLCGLFGPNKRGMDAYP